MIKQIFFRYDFKNPVLDKLKFFKPQLAVQHSTRDKMPSLLPLLSSLPRISKREDFQDIDDEWRRLPLHQFDNDDLKLEIDVFWGKAAVLKNEIGEFLFKKVAQFVLGILSLPHSNADSERVFSQINLAKTKNRSKLIVPTIKGIILANQHIKKAGGCSKFQPSKEMLSRMTSKSLYGYEKATVNEERTIDEEEEVDVVSLTE